MNENTTEDANFFLIEIEAWKIGDSPPAPRFNIIPKPNDWAKTIKQASAGARLTDLNLRRQSFWEKVKEYGEHNSRQVRSWQIALPQAWYSITIGSSLVHLAATVNSRRIIVGMELYINDSKDLFF